MNEATTDLCVFICLFNKCLELSKWDKKNFQVVNTAEVAITCDIIKADGILNRTSKMISNTYRL